MNLFICLDPYARVSSLLCHSKTQYLPSLIHVQKFIYLFYITHVQGGPAKVKPTYMFAGNI